MFWIIYNYIKENIEMKNGWNVSDLKIKIIWLVAYFLNNITELKLKQEAKIFHYKTKDWLSLIYQNTILMLQ